MNPIIEVIQDEIDTLKFTLKRVDVSVANALRKTAIADIPSVVFDVDNPVSCIFYKNNTRFHNEILKERLRAIPLHVTHDLEQWAANHYVEIDIQNEINEYCYVTTAQFKIKRTSDDSELSEDERNTIFPKNKFQNYIDFARLAPFVHENIVAEGIHLRCGFMVSTARTNGCFSMVSKCSYENTRDLNKISDEWNRREQAMRKEGHAEERIEFEKRDFYCLDAQRHYVPRSFDFIVETIGVYTNIEIVRTSCIVLQHLCVELTELLRESPESVLFLSGSVKDYSTMENSYDVLLPNHMANLGAVLNDLLFSNYFSSDGKKTQTGNNIEMTYCSFKKIHPHDTYYTLRVAFSGGGIEDVKLALTSVVIEAGHIFEKLHKLVSP